MTTTAETFIADLDGELAATVDGDGAVRLVDRGWVLDWMVATEAGWRSATDAGTGALRQQLVDQAPVVQTSLRLDGGQLVHRAFVAADRDGTPTVVVEVRNDSPHAVGMAFVVRPASSDQSVPAVEWASDGAGETVVRIGEQAVAVLPDPAEVVTGADDDELIRALVAGSDRGATGGAVVAGSEGSRVALVRPLPHTLTTRISLSPATGVSPTRVADGEAVARGWARHVRGGCRVELPEPVLRDLVAASRAQVLLAVRADRDDIGVGRAVADERLAEALRAMGQGRLAAGLGARWLTQLSAKGLVDDGSGDGIAATGAALAILGGAAGDLEPDEVEEWLPEVSGMLVGLDKSERRASGGGARWDRYWADAGRRGAIAVLGAVGQDRAAGEVAARRAPDRASDATFGPDALVGALDERGAATPSWRRMLAARAAIGRGRWPEDDLRWLLSTTDRTGVMPLGVDDHLVAAEVVALWRDLGATERADGTVMLLPAVRSRWLGHPLEAHDVAIGAGSVGFAIRWHGERPALLWESRGMDGRTLTCPGLDPAWSSTGARGDALLATPSLAPVESGIEPPAPSGVDEESGGSFS